MASQVRSISAPRVISTFAARSTTASRRRQLRRPTTAGCSTRASFPMAAISRCRLPSRSKLGTVFKQGATLNYDLPAPARSACPSARCCRCARDARGFGCAGDGHRGRRDHLQCERHGGLCGQAQVLASDVTLTAGMQLGAGDGTAHFSCLRSADLAEGRTSLPIDMTSTRHRWLWRRARSSRR